MYCTPQQLVCSIVGTTISDIRPLVYALNIVIQLHFNQNTPRENIKVTHSVYPKVAQQLDKSPIAVARSVERLANLCFDIAKQQGRISEIFGHQLIGIPSAADILFYMAYFIQYGDHFFNVIKNINPLNPKYPSI